MSRFLTRDLTENRISPVLEKKRPDAKKSRKQLATASDGQVTNEPKSLPAIESRRAQRVPIEALQLH